jgi:transposase
MWCVAELNREYIEKMEDVLAVYEKPHNPAEPVVCVDEKPVSLHADVRPPIPAAPGRMAKRDNEYQRCGTANVFCAVEPKAGRHFTLPTPNRSAPEFAQALGSIVSSYPLARRIHLVMDNLNIHCRKSLTDYFGEEKGVALWKRLRVHYTPKHGSWLNQAEIEISLFSRQCLGRRRLPTLAILRRETRAWNRHVNRNRVQINWGFTRQRARAKFGYNRNLLRRSKT